MRRNFFWIPFMLFALFFAGCDNNPKIAVIDSEKVITESEPGRMAMAHLEGLSKKIQEKFVALQTSVEEAAEEERMAIEAKAQDDFRNMQQQFSDEQQKTFSRVDELYTKVVADVRADKKIDAVFEASTVISYDKNLDITDEIIAAMNKAPLSFDSIEVSADISGDETEAAISETPLTPDEDKASGTTQP